MGYGSYTSLDWATLKNKRNISSATNTQQIFSNSRASRIFDCRNVAMRESRDSADSPKSTPVIIGFDVTGSMGYLAKELAVNSINKTILSLLENKSISNPQIMCSAIGDCKSDDYPLQVTQFEADIRIMEQLIELYLEGRGGGNGGESYNLLWYFAANHTYHDCHEKRGKKGFLFTIGDDSCHPDLTEYQINNLFGDQVSYPMSNAEILRQVEKKYHVFHIHLYAKSVFSMSYTKNIISSWQETLPGGFTMLERDDVNLVSELITTIINMYSGMDAASALSLLDEATAEKLAQPISMITVKNGIDGKLSF